MRLFVAINFPDALGQALWTATATLRAREPSVKWVRPEGLHLTLKFLGEVDDARLADCRAALGRAAVGARALTLTVGEFGAFPSLERPRVVWAGVGAEPGLELLQHATEREFTPLGFPTEGRPFRPHLTLGRVGRGAVPRGLARVLEQLTFQETALITSIDLMQSTLGPNGAVHEAVSSERLS